MRSSSTGFAASRSSTARMCSCSRALGKPLGRYFPELVLPPGPLRARRRDRRPRRAMATRTSTRSASASTRPPRASSACPSRRPPCYVAFDLLARDDESLLERAVAERRAALEQLLAGRGVRRRARRADGDDRHRCTGPAWLRARRGRDRQGSVGALPPGERKGMSKVKRVRTIDAVLAGWRPGKEPDTVGALILGLYDGPRAARRRALLRAHRLGEAPAGRLPRPYETGERGSADPSRWSSGKELEWVGAAPRAGRGDRLRPRLRRAHPPRGQAAPLARGQAARASARSISCPCESSHRGMRRAVG